MPRVTGIVSEMKESRASWLAKLSFSTDTGSVIELSARLENYKDSENPEEIKMLLDNETGSPSRLPYEIEFYEVEEKGYTNRYLSRAKVIEDKAPADKPVDDKPVASSWEQVASNKDIVISRSVAYNQIMQSLATTIASVPSTATEASPVATWFEIMKAHEGSLNELVDVHTEIIRGVRSQDDQPQQAVF